MSWVGAQLVTMQANIDAPPNLYFIVTVAVPTHLRVRASQAWFEPLHAWQVDPAAPQAANVVPGWQVPDEQQPAGHVVLSQESLQDPAVQVS